MVDLGKRLKQLRKENNLTQKQLALQIGVQNAVISFYEVGERYPSPEVLVKLASTLHVTTDYLLGIDKGETVDVSGLSDEDKALVRALVERLRKQN
jgi:transcriptional regulator with XRE-family HTH domain